MYYVQPIQPILGLRPISLVYCNPSLLGYIMKVTPLIRVCGVSLHGITSLGNQSWVSSSLLPLLNRTRLPPSASALPPPTDPHPPPHGSRPGRRCRVSFEPSPPPLFLRRAAACEAPARALQVAAHSETTLQSRARPLLRPSPRPAGRRMSILAPPPSPASFPQLRHDVFVELLLHQ
jgi:hypothetical protein